MSSKIIINCSNLKQGGALQVALSFINESAAYPQYEFHVFLSKKLSPLVNAELRKKSNCIFYDIDFYGTDGFAQFRKFRKHLSALEASIKPTLVISVFGPCYWKPKAAHIMGFANGYLLYEDLPFFGVWHGHKKLPYRIKKMMHRYLLKSEANHYWIETEDAKVRLAKFVNKPLPNIIVASNNCSDFFYQKNYEAFNDLPVKNKFRLVYVSAYYEHKNFSFIPKVLNELIARGYKVEVIITIDPIIYGNNTEIQHPDILNIGPVHPKYCPFLYEQSDAVFMPSMLETFSANYPEAMYMQKPIITSDLSFAKDICGDAAVFYEFNNVEDAALKIVSVMDNDSLRSELISKGLKKLSNFDTPRQRFEKILAQGLTII
jgi:glycosyltransferase involved in cell wall biosynthesis